MIDIKGEWIRQKRLISMFIVLLTNNRHMSAGLFYFLWFCGTFPSSIIRDSVGMVFLNILRYCSFFSFMPSTLEKLKEHIDLGLSVRLCVRSKFIRYSFEISCMNSSSKNNWHIFFLSLDYMYLTLWSYAPFKGSWWYFIIKISQKLLQLWASNLVS